MNWKDYLKAQGFTDAEIGTMETTWGVDKLTKMFAEPVAKLAEAQRKLDEATTRETEFRTFYEGEVLPKISTVYQDAINARTREAAVNARLAAAQEYGFLSETAGVVPGVPAGAPVTAHNAPGPAAVNPVPGSPGAPGAPAFDPSKYVEASKFTEAVNSIPDMLGRLSDVSNEYYRLYNAPIPDTMTSLIDEARKTKKTVSEVAAIKYKFDEKRAAIAAEKAAAHDKQVADEAVRKWASEHHMPFTTPARSSNAPLFKPATVEDARHPWKNSRERKQERRQTMLEAMYGKPATAAVQ